MGQVEGDGDDGDAVAGEDEGRDVARVVGGLGITEDGAVGVADVDDAVELLAWWVLCQIGRFECARCVMVLGRWGEE